MARNQDGQAGAVLMAFVLGAVSGAAVALLWAPSPGEDTRRLLNDKAREGRERTRDAARQGREFVRRGRESLTSAIDRGREAYELRTATAVAEVPAADEDATEAPA